MLWRGMNLHITEPPDAVRDGTDDRPAVVELLVKDEAPITLIALESGRREGLRHARVTAPALRLT